MMIFPFIIHFEKILVINPLFNTNEVFDLIKENIIYESNAAAVGFVLKDGELSFRTTYNNGAPTWTMKTIDKGIFTIYVENNLIVLKYKYYIGRLYLYLAGIGMLGLITSAKPLKYKLQIILIFCGSIVFCSWVATFLGQRWMFKRIVRKIEDKWGNYN
jgi:hypothetical protein